MFFAINCNRDWSFRRITMMHDNRKLHAEQRSSKKEEPPEWSVSPTNCWWCSSRDLQYVIEPEVCCCCYVIHPVLEYNVCSFSRAAVVFCPSLKLLGCLNLIDTQHCCIFLVWKCNLRIVYYRKHWYDASSDTQPRRKRKITPRSRHPGMLVSRYIVQIYLGWRTSTQSRETTVEARTFGKSAHHSFSPTHDLQRVL